MINIRQYICLKPYNPTKRDVRQDLIPHTPFASSNYWFKEQPDDDPLTRPKHEVEYYTVMYIT
jgi:hypothetical protein